jgi:HAD superfamily hydrolase (TIGR01490 family)
MTNLTLFDLDGTLIARDSDHAFGEFMVDVGWANGPEWRERNNEFFRQYQDGRLDLDGYVDFATSVWRGRPLSEALAMRERFMQEVIRPTIAPRALELVREHQAAGDRVAIVTATNEFVTRPIADAFGVDTLIAVELQRHTDGRPTGRVMGVPSFREGKIERVRQWLASTFYSDSMNDLPLLEVVSDPVATNPSPALEAVARERGWRILRLLPS